MENEILQTLAQQGPLVITLSAGIGVLWKHLQERERRCEEERRKVFDQMAGIVEKNTIAMVKNSKSMDSLIRKFSK